MNIILLSGGSGKRLWPLSNDIRSKQFIKFLKKSDDTYESMLQRVYRQIKNVNSEANVTIATSKSQVSAIHNQLGVNVGISVEPCRRDTFPAIALATAYLHDIQHISENEAVVVCPVDPYVDDSYFECIRDLYEEAQKGKSNLTLMGIKPTYPSEKYGYIIPFKHEADDEAFLFREKPNVEKAKEYLSLGAMWNGGVFAYQLKYVLGKAKELLGTSDYAELFSQYNNLKKISFDYAVVEQEKSIKVIQYSGTWKDLGTWNTLTEAMEGKAIGKVSFDDKCQNVHVINELDIPILAMGLKDLVISASSDGILVSDKLESSQIKSYVDNLEEKIRYAEKSWGEYKVLDVDDDAMTIKVTLKPGQHMNYHSHDKRDEVWTVIRGKGKTIVDGMEQEITDGDVITMSAGCKHTVIAETELQLIEVQIGENISVTDKHKYEMP